MLAAVKARIEDRIPGLAHRVRLSADFATLMSGNTLPQQTTAYIVGAGIQGQDPSLVGGSFVQPIRETVSVVVCFKSTHQRAEDATDELTPMRDDILRALCGWQPGDEVGVMQLVSGRVLGFKDGALFYGIDFAINDQLRVPT